MSHLSRPRTYSEFVEAGRNILTSMRLHQLYVAHYTVQVCDIRHGGRSKGFYTIKDYAEDIGINRKTLSGWCSIYRIVIQKLDLDLDSITPDDWQTATRVHDLLKNEKRAINALVGEEKSKDKGWKQNAPEKKIRDLFNRYKNGTPIEAQVHSWTDRAIDIKNRIITKDLSGASTESLMMLKKQLDGASENITNYLMDHRGVSIGELI